MRQKTVRVTAACAVLLVSAAAGCGSGTGDGDDPGTATDTSSTEAGTSDAPTSDSPTYETGAGAEFVVGETVEPGQAQIVSTSNVDGETATRASALVDDRAVDAFLSATDARLAADVRAAVAAVEVPADSTLFGAVVAVGCDTPTAVTWETTFDGIEVTPTVPKSGVQCLVPVTSVALFAVPN